MFAQPVFFATDHWGAELRLQWISVGTAVDLLTRSGYQALLAGGCVRDVLLGREPKDFDIATDATPDQVESLFPNALTIGKSFGVTIIPVELKPGQPQAGHFQLEIATFREDLEYHDGRRPSGVRFATVEGDAKRRDFTINAMFYDLKTSQLLDFVNGRRDLTARVIRTVGEASSRFQEDHLRILRAVRFSAQLDFKIDPQTLSAMTELAGSVASVSRERVRDEMLKLLAAPGRIAGLEILCQSGLLRVLFPSLAQKLESELELWSGTFSRASSLGPAPLQPELLLAIFFRPVFVSGSERAFREMISKELKLDGLLIKSILFILGNLEIFLNPGSIRRGELIRLAADDAAASTRQLAALVEPKLAALRETQIQDLVGSSHPLPVAFLTGQSAQALGLRDGPEMGRLLREAYLLQLEGSFSDVSSAEAWLKSKLN